MNKTEKIAYGQLRAQGYLVEKPVRTKWHRVDLFGIWDFIAIDEKEVRFIQVSEKYFTQKPKAEQDEMLNFPAPPGAKKEYWHWNEKLRNFIITLIDKNWKERIKNVRRRKNN